MKAWFSDTLFLRLFLLMWIALVISHIAAFSVATQFFPPLQAGGSKASPPSGPTFPSLPPTPGLVEPHPVPGHPGAGPGPFVRDPLSGPGDSLRPGGAGDLGTPGPPSAPGGWGLTLLDYGVRLLFIGLAAWVGARWLSAPMRRLSAAASGLRDALATDSPVPRLDETGGTLEVRETAHVFNDMAGHLQTQFKARGLLMASLSHDLRTPLTRMRLRLARLPEDPLVERCVGDIRDMDELIDSALSLFRDTTSLGPMQSTDVCSVVQSLADDLIEQGLPVTFCGDVAVANCHPVLLRRVVSNLVSNALRYGRRADVSVESYGAQVSVVVCDAGSGIPEEQLDAVFEPFYRLEKSRSRDTGGVGLGLFIARDLVTRQGGSITLSNRPEGGLRAAVSLHSAAS